MMLSSRLWRAFCTLLVLTGLLSVAARAQVQSSDPMRIYVVNYPLQFFAERIAEAHAEVILPIPKDIFQQTDQQITRPEEVIDGLLENIFRIKDVLDAVILVVALATALTIVLVFALSLRLRQREIETIFMLGCRRMTVARLLAAEIGIIVLVSGIICMAMLLVVDRYSSEVVRVLFIR